MMIDDDGVLMDDNRQFRVGDTVRVVRPNSEAELPQGMSPGLNLGNTTYTLIEIGKEYTLGVDMPEGYDLEDEYDDDDNSWRVWSSVAGGGWSYDWVHEGAMEPALLPVTQDEEDEALASILKAMRD